MRRADMTATLLTPTCLLAAALVCAAAASSIPDASSCSVAARTHAGCVCGVRRRTAGVEYASFLGVPYAKQPLGKLRFQELQPVEPWDEPLNATRVGPVCPQTDILYKQLMKAEGGMGEDCIHANIHVPLHALPRSSCAGAGAAEGADGAGGAGLPILVFIHGGGFAFGSGDPDLHGPEFLLRNDVIVITFNYRLNVFGFLSLNSSFVPGNNGLRDCVSLLRWVRRNAAGFGGDARAVTLAGQSAGAVLAHTLTLVPAAEGLFRSVIAMSGVATSDFFSSSPQFAAQAGALLLRLAGAEPAAAAARVHDQLAAAPLERLLRANKQLLDLYGLTTFVPVVESPHPGVTPMLLEEPEALLRAGGGSSVPLLLGYTDAECETFRPRLREFNISAKVSATPALLLPPRLLYQARQATLPLLIKETHSRYLGGEGAEGAEDGFVRFCTEGLYQAPAMRVADQRLEAGGAPVYVYKFSYGGAASVVKEALGLSFAGAGHVEDLTYVFRADGFLGRAPLDPRDQRQADCMTSLFLDFINDPYAVPSAGACSAGCGGGAGWSRGARLHVRAARACWRERDADERAAAAFYRKLYATARPH